MILCGILPSAGNEERMNLLNIINIQQNNLRGLYNVCI